MYVKRCYIILNVVSFIISSTDNLSVLLRRLLYKGHNCKPLPPGFLADLVLHTARETRDEERPIDKVNNVTCVMSVSV